VHGTRYVAGCLQPRDWPRIKLGSLVLVRLSSELCPLLPALLLGITSSAEHPTTPTGVRLLLRPSLACSAVCHTFPAQRVRVLFLAMQPLCPIPTADAPTPRRS
jgi:hypothetical protein